MKILKTSILVLFIILGTQSLHAQIQNTSWNGVFNMGSPQECIFEFKTDTVYLKLEGNVIETGLFKISGDTLTMQKLSGGSPCDNDVIGVYRFTIKDDKLTITVIDDDCQLRVNAFPQEPMTAVKQ